MAQLITVHLNKSEQQPLGFRLQGGKDFGTPLVVQKVNGGSAAERAGLQAGDALVRVNNTDVYLLRHQEAQDTIRAAGTNLELVVQRGGGTWRPSVTPTGSLPRPNSRPLGGSPALVTNTSLKANAQPSRAFGSGHNNVAKPFSYMNGNDAVKSIVNKQYNTPVNMYSDKTIAETLSAQTEVLAGGVLGVNFKKNEKTYDSEKSAVFKVLQEEQNDPEPEMSAGTCAPPPVSGLRSVQAPVTRPDAPLNTGGLPPGQNICEECERLITGVFVRIKDKNLHVECFKCSTCGSSLKNQGYYNLNGKLYCDIHAKLVARQNPPGPNLDPVTVPPGARIPTNTYSTPLPPLATNYTNGSSSLFSPSSNVSGPKPFGSSIGSAYSPSLSPRSAPMSPARPVHAPAPAPLIAPPAAAPFAPTQNIKSIVWPPPPVPSDDEPPKYEPNQKFTNPSYNQQPTPGMVSKICSNLDSNIGYSQQQQNMEKSVTSSKQKEALTSSVSYASAAATSSVSATSKSESIVQSNQSQILQETSCHTVQSSSVKSFTHESSESQSIMFYETQAKPSDLKDCQNPKENIEHIKKAQITESKEAIHLKSSNEIRSSNLKMPTQGDNTSKVYQSNKNKEQCTENSINNSLNYTNVSRDTKSVDKMTEEVFHETKFSDRTECRQLSQNQQSVASEMKPVANVDNKQLLGNLKTSTTDFKHTDSNLGSVHNITPSLVDALTTAPDRPYSPLPTPPQPLSTISQRISEEKINQSHEELKLQIHENAELLQQLPTQPASMHMLEPKRNITPIPPIKTSNPSEKTDVPVPMPEETKPYIPPDFKILVEPKEPREQTSSPLVDALTTAPNRPFTPIMSYNEPQCRGSLREALTIAPDRPYSPFYSNNIIQSSEYLERSTSQSYETSTQDILKPIATQTSTHVADKMSSKFSTIQNTCKLQTSSEISAFKPVNKQVHIPPQPEEFCKLTDFPAITNEQKHSFTKSVSTKQEFTLSESMSMHQSSFTPNTYNQEYSSIKNAQNYFENLDKKESCSSTAVRNKSGLHKPDSIPPYQRNFEQLPSQRGITPELYSAPAVLQRPVTPTTDPPTKAKEKSLEPDITQTTPNRNYGASRVTTPKIPQIRTPVQQQSVQFYKDTPITMTFQPVSDNPVLRTSPIRSRPTTPSLINKPAPIIPHYQMNLVAVEHTAAESYLYEPSSREPSRSPTPKPRSRSPAQGPPPNPLKAQAPRIKESGSPWNSLDSFKECENTPQTTTQLHNTVNMRNTEQNQSPVVREQTHTSTGFKSENYTKDDIKYKEDSMIHENYGQRQMQSQNVIEHGNTTVHTTRKSFEEFERTQSAKVIEIRKGGSPYSGAYDQMQANIRPSNINSKQVFPPPTMSLPISQQNSSFNVTNKNIGTIRTVENMNDEPKPSISGANLDPVCDPTPSTGSSVGAAARGKTFGVSSAPKRGRGILNKAALPGSRVPLCASCNGNIRGPFITALGRIWCPEHFICVNASCRRPLQDIGFVEENGQLYCEYCFEQYIAPACDKCHAKIKGDCLNAIGKHFHPECFNCVYCGKLFGNNPFFLEDGLPYCEADWNELFTTKCFACGFPVEAGDRWVEALNNNYHSQCFNCTVCKKNLEGQSFFAKGGRPFCKTHAR